MRWLLGAWAAVLLLLGTPPPITPAATGHTVTASRLTALFTEYGDTSGSWLGADRTASVRLPDGRTLWLFSDTFLGRPTAEGARPRSAGFVHNSLVVQEGDKLTGTIVSPFPAEGGEFHWVGDAAVSGTGVQVLVNRYRRNGTGPLDQELLGTGLSTVALPGLSPSPVRALPVGKKVSWGSEVLPDGEFTYVYGTEAAGDLKFAHLARVRGADLGAAWEFWTGRAWSPRVADSGRLLSGVGTNYGVRRYGEQYVLVTHENNLTFSADVVAYTAPSPTGPWSGPDYLFRAPEIDDGHIVYDTDLHPHLASTGKLLVSYNVNNLDETTAARDAGIYRPRFVEVDWPPAAGAEGRPAAPSGLTAQALRAGSADLAWKAPAGRGLSYHVYRRDVTAGQSHFVRLPGDGPGARRTYGSDFLVNGRTYEFAVTAVDARGESELSNVATMAATVPPPAPPSGLVAAAGAAGDVALRWAKVPYVQVFRVYRRDLTAGERQPVPVGEFPHEHATVAGLRHDHRYEFTVVAVGGGGDSRPSTPAVATAVVTPPPAPTGVTARLDGGAVRLAWASLGDGVAYRVLWRDVSEGDSGWRPPALAGDDTSYTLRGVQAGHEYEVAVAAVNDGGAGQPSRPVRVKVPAAAPKGLRAEITDDGVVELRWRPAGWFAVLHRDLTAGQKDFTQDPVPVQGDSARLATLTAGHRYQIKVATQVPGGVGPATGPVEVTLPSPVPTGLAVTSPAAGQARLTWRESKPGLMFQVRLRDATAGEPWRTDPYPAGGGKFEAALLTSGHRYEFRLVVVHGPGDEHASATVATTIR